jgi:hypothetical protein
VPIIDYKVRCRAGEGEPIESKEGVSLETSTTIDGLTNGTAYQCEVATVGAASMGAWTAAATPATPVGRPGPPAKPSVAALDRALRISVTPADATTGVSAYHYECSADGGATWSRKADVASDANTTAQVGNLTNGIAYVCRAFAENTMGLSDASPLSNIVKPCGSLIECNAALAPVVGILGVVLVGGLLAAFIAVVRERRRGYVVAVVDVIHTANLGHGSRLGIRFDRAPDSKVVTGIVADRGPTADIRVRQLRGGRFEVTDGVGRRHKTTDGEPVMAVVAGVRHQVVLHAFATNAASPVTSRR